jgi:arginyl-tRNA--protein-N-Asp/Glu arginylyltransferase
MVGMNERPVPSLKCVSWSSLGALALLAAVSGCGNALYALEANAASSKVEEARELGAEQYAPYEYYLAKEHLEKAQSEASEADYSDAAELAEEAALQADKAIRLAREAHRGAGR